MTTPGSRAGRPPAPARAARPAASPRTPGQRAATGTRLWPLLGSGVVAVIAAADVAAAFLVADEPASATNLAGTLALAPALTGAGGTRRQTLAVGVLAVAVAALLLVADGVHLYPGLVRLSGVALGAVLATWVAGLRRTHLAQLQDRRQAARTLQEAMLTALPRLQHLELASRYVPAGAGERVGGDWYDAVVTPAGTVVVIGDVAGHDVRAAATMGQLRAVLRAYAVDRDEPPSRLLRRLDRALPVLGLDVLATVVVVRVEEDPGIEEAPGIEQDPGAGREVRGARRIRWSNAGHPPPLLLHPDGRVDVLTGAPDLLLGLDPGAERGDATCAMPPGATLLLYTDGLVERRDATLDDGLRRLADALAAGAGTHLDDLLDAVLADFAAGGNADDVAVIAVRAHPRDRPRPARAGPRREPPAPPPS